MQNAVVSIVNNFSFNPENEDVEDGSWEPITFQQLGGGSGQRTSMSIHN